MPIDFPSDRLHWVKDVVFHEDVSTIHMGNAPANLSVFDDRIQYSQT